MEEKDFVKVLKAIEEEYLFKGTLSSEDQDALLMSNDEVLFTQIISREFAQRCSDFIIKKNKFKKSDDKPSLCGIKSKSRELPSISVSEEDIASLDEDIQSNKCDERLKRLYVKHKEIVDNYCIFIGCQEQNVVKEGINTLFCSLKFNRVVFSHKDRIYLAKKILSIRKDLENQSEQDFNLFRNILSLSICGYFAHEES